MPLELVSGAFLSSQFQTLFDNLASSEVLDFFRKKKLDPGLLKNLEILLISAEAVLDDAEGKRRGNPHVRKWLLQLKEEIYAVEDLIFEISNECLPTDMEGESSSRPSKVRAKPFFSKTACEKEIEPKIQKIIDTLKLLLEQKTHLGLEETSVHNGSYNSQRLLATPIVEESDVYGREDDKEKIIDLLLSNDDSGNKIQVIPIVGMGGIGKTTLAGLVYNNDRVSKSFDVKAWVTVSEYFDTLRLTKTILQNVEGSQAQDNKDLNQLQEALKKALNGRKFFFVLDDVWNKKCNLWCDFMRAFETGARGSKLIVTTRDEKIASMVAPNVRPHQLGPISDEECRKLLAKHVFCYGSPSAYPNMEVISRKIVETCKGLPLAVISLAGLSRGMTKKKFFKRNGGRLLEQQFDSGEADVEETKLFESEELEKATDSFKIDRVLGQGGQDTVYKGMLRDGNIVAVKKYKIVDERRVEEFINEVVNLSKVNHRNVVKLLGCCLQTEDPLLFYEYVPNGTLYQYIYDEQEEFPLTWEIRLRIATEIAGALTHLHSSATLSTYRRDISSKNILLDGQYRAKLADIGTSRSAAIDDQRDLIIAGQGIFDLADTGTSRSVAVDDETDFTTAVHGPSGLADIGTSRSDATDEQTDLTTAGHGTFGNLDPKQSSQSTKMSDVYGFGVVLVELLVGKKLVSIQRSKQGTSPVTYFMQSMEEKKLFNTVDARVKKEGKKASIIAFAELAKRCLNSNAKKRPAMKEVAAVLEDIRKSEVKASDADDEEEGENGTWLPSLGDLTNSSSFVLP